MLPTLYDDLEEKDGDLEAVKEGGLGYAMDGSDRTISICMI